MEQENNHYRHVVLFEFKDGTPETAVKRIEMEFRALCAQLPLVRDFEWGRNSSPENLNNGFTHCFIVTFSNEKDRDTYLPHPAHIAFCKDFLDDHLKKACVVDFQPEK